MLCLGICLNLPIDRQLVESESNQLTDFNVLKELVFDECEKVRIPKVVLIRLENDVEYLIRIKTEVSYQSFDVFFNSLYVLLRDIGLVELNEEF